MNTQANLRNFRTFVKLHCSSPRRQHVSAAKATRDAEGRKATWTGWSPVFPLGGVRLAGVANRETQIKENDDEPPFSEFGRHEVACTSKSGELTFL